LALFDVDGTLVDTAGAGRFALRSAFLQTFHEDVLTRAETRGTVRFAGMTDLAIIQALAWAGGIEPARLEEEKSRLIINFFRHLETEMVRLDGQAQALPGVHALLERLEQVEQVRTGLVTGNLESGARIKLQPFGLNRFFPAGGFGSDHIDRKEVARIGMEKMCGFYDLSVRPEQVVIIGDTEKDVECARANGYRAVAVQFRWVSKKRLLESKPDFYLEDLTDIPAFLEALGIETKRAAGDRPSVGTPE